MRPGAKGRRKSRSRYAEIAAEGAAGQPDPVAHAKSTGYSEQELDSVPDDAVVSLGCGNPVARAELRAGEMVLDLGCGAGLDALLAAQRVGPKGRVIGVDQTPEMVQRAADNAAKAGARNVEFRHAAIERLPLEDGSVDVAISNCVMNHCADKVLAFKEVYRVLKHGGRIWISDLVAAGGFSDAALKDEIWGEWLAVALPKAKYFRTIENAGFRDLTVAGEATFAMAEADARLKGRITSLLLTARK
ncbi:MAG: hypothetical protein A3K19_14730 [Lentisphaerae bacterium RIFOXYB12_FULL_65_16]|nr:MAG: hypothetical protein A3K18_14440 [Lentisphaerae bacterium RIFOXYA12_64_32]OGV87831.1 MAG: hypothetical protein A3K19_14730 [Lentisphaerae bacterium RIFOXYB12_FULL_65_16]